MFRVGYEIECISPHSKAAVKKLLHDEFLHDDVKVPAVESDPTIGSTIKRPHQIEIITPPMGAEHLGVLERIFKLCDDNDMKSNRTTGLHVNVSFEEKSLNKWLNPLHVLNELDYDAILEKWGRSNQLYSRSFQYYYKKIHRNVMKKYKLHDWTDISSLNAWNHDLAYNLSTQKFIGLIMGGSDHLLDKYNENVYHEFDEKHICMNLGYLSNRGYIEFRMIGGTKYLTNFQDVKTDVEEILEAMRRAIKRSTA